MTTSVPRHSLAAIAEIVHPDSSVALQEKELPMSGLKVFGLGRKSKKPVAPAQPAPEPLKDEDLAAASGGAQGQSLSGDPSSQLRGRLVRGGLDESAPTWTEPHPVPPTGR